MKRICITIAGLALAVGLVGCHMAQRPLPVGAVNAVDAQINSDLQTARTAILKYQADVAAGLHKATPTETMVVHNLAHAINVADPLYQSYHAALLANPGAGEPAELAAALTAVAQNKDMILALIKGGK